MLAILLALQCGKSAKCVFQIYESSKDPYTECQIGKRQCITAL